MRNHTPLKKKITHPDGNMAVTTEKVLMHSPITGVCGLLLEVIPTKKGLNPGS